MGIFTNEEAHELTKEEKERVLCIGGVIILLALIVAYIQFRTTPRLTSTETRVQESQVEPTTLATTFAEFSDRFWGRK